LHSEELHILCSSPDIWGRSNQGEWGQPEMWHTWERRGKCTGFWWESLKERDNFEDRGIDGRMGSERISGRLADVGVVEWIKF
jgi:hypothetical protein